MGKNSLGNNANDDFNAMFGNPNDGSVQTMPPGLKAIAMMLQGGRPEDLITSDSVEFHNGKKIILPKGSTYSWAMETLERLQRDEETEIRLDRKFNFRPNDGAVAAARVLKRRYGITFGEPQFSMFGDKIPPSTRTVQISPTTTIDVPWDQISIPSLKGVNLMFCDRHPHKEYGQVFEVHATLMKKFQGEIKLLFDEIEQELQTNSIYRGKAVAGADDLEFMDLSGFKAGEIVFAKHVEEILEGTVLSVIKHRETMVQEGIKIKRTALLYGPYGTGKTSAGLIIAQIANQHGWTFLSARPGRDDIEDVLKTAKLYQPAVVFVEDIDGQASGGTDSEVSELLDAFDGITAKGGELVVVMTTNHLERIHKGMLRPGRLDAVIEISSLDRRGIERLIKAVVPSGKLDANVDYDAVFASMEGFYPAFVREATERAKTFAISRQNGDTDYVLTTADLVGAAASLHEQLQLLEAANEGEHKSTIDDSIAKVVKATVDGAHFVENQNPGRGADYAPYKLRVNGADHEGVRIRS